MGKQEEPRLRKGCKVTIRFNIGRHPFRGRRPCNREEIAAWYASDDSKGMTCDGETKLPPQVTTIALVAGRQYTVLRARCRPLLGYYHKPGLALLECPATGEQFYVPREACRVVQS